MPLALFFTTCDKEDMWSISLLAIKKKKRKEIQLIPYKWLINYHADEYRKLVGGDYECNRT